MRLPFFKSKPPAPAERPRNTAKTARTAALGSDEAVALARTRARRRLVGALVLLLAGVVGFPLLFETQPRPLPLDTPIEVNGRKLTEAPAAAPVAAPRPPPVLPPDAGAETAVAPVVVAAPVVASAPPVAASRPALPRPPMPAPSAAAPAAVATVKPAAVPAAATAATPQAAASAPGRFVVQVGAYTDAATLREARAKVEKLGMKTYTQVIESDAGKRTRVRLGPFATRQEADAAAAKVKRTGLPANIITL